MSNFLGWILRWTARVAAVLIAGIFFTFLAAEPRGSLGAIHAWDWVGLSLLFVCIAAMLVAWKWEFPGSLVSLAALAAFAAVVQMNHYDVLFIAAIPSLLFLADWELRRVHAAHASKTA